jgi:hypothetical protein
MTTAVSDMEASAYTDAAGLKQQQHEDNLREDSSVAKP